MLARRIISKELLELLNIVWKSRRIEGLHPLECYEGNTRKTYVGHNKKENI